MNPNPQMYLVKPLGPKAVCYMLPYKEIRARLAAKTLVRRDGPPTFYEEVAKAEDPKPAPPEPSEELQVYQTRDMVARPGYRLHRDRPRKQQVPAE